MDASQEDLRAAKQALRSQIKRERKELGSWYCIQADQLIFSNLKSTKEYKKSKRIFCYVSLEEEVDTRRIIREALGEGKRVSVPRCKKDGQMEAYEIKSLQDLEEGFHGISEPKAHCIQTDPGQFDLCIVPCLSCTEEGLRLGYGGGYYDRYLPKTSGFRILLCREMLVYQCIPAEKHDCFMDMVITEKRIIFC